MFRLSILSWYSSAPSLYYSRPPAVNAVYKKKKKWSFTSIVYSIVYLELEENLHQGNKGQAKR